MIQLPPVIDRIKALLAEGTEASVTYAALEARLALEKVCYDRLRQYHDYISHAQLKRWQPGAVVTTLMTQVDPHVAETFTISMSKNPFDADSASHDNQEWVTLGTQVGFDAKKIAKMWQALANLALHVRLPTHSTDEISDYGDAHTISSKVKEVLVELERLSKATIATSGIGEEMSFHCICGEKNRRRKALLKDGQEIFCVNPKCKYTWRVVQKGIDVNLESITIEINCDRCGAPNLTPSRFYLDMKPDQVGSFACHSCQHKNLVQWRLMQVRQEPEPKSAI